MTSRKRARGEGTDLSTTLAVPSSKQAALTGKSLQLSRLTSQQSRHERALNSLRAQGYMRSGLSPEDYDRRMAEEKQTLADIQTQLDELQQGGPIPDVDFDLGLDVFRRARALALGLGLDLPLPFDVDVDLEVENEPVAPAAAATLRELTLAMNGAPVSTSGTVWEEEEEEEEATAVRVPCRNFPRCLREFGNDAKETKLRVEHEFVCPYSSAVVNANGELQSSVSAASEERPLVEAATEAKQLLQSVLSDLGPGTSAVATVTMATPDGQAVVASASSSSEPQVVSYEDALVSISDIRVPPHLSPRGQTSILRVMVCLQQMQKPLAVTRRAFVSIYDVLQLFDVAHVSTEEEAWVQALGADKAVLVQADKRTRLWCATPTGLADMLQSAVVGGRNATLQAWLLDKILPVVSRAFAPTDGQPWSSAPLPIQRKSADDWRIEVSCPSPTLCSRNSRCVFVQTYAEPNVPDAAKFPIATHRRTNNSYLSLNSLVDIGVVPRNTSVTRLGPDNVVHLETTYLTGQALWFLLHEASITSQQTLNAVAWIAQFVFPLLFHGTPVPVPVPEEEPEEPEELEEPEESEKPEEPEEPEELEEPKEPKEQEAKTPTQPQEEPRETQAPEIAQPTVKKTAEGPPPRRRRRRRNVRLGKF